MTKKTQKSEILRNVQYLATFAYAYSENHADLNQILAKKNNFDELKLNNLYS